jgi:hypothetical protein
LRRRVVAGGRLRWSKGWRRAAPRRPAGGGTRDRRPVVRSSSVQRAGQRRSCWCGEVLYCCVVCARAGEVLAAVRDLLILLRATVVLVKSGAAV